MFPSPCGEKVGINKDLKPGEVIVPVEFPSPCGEKVGINAAMVPAMFAAAGVVSVPLRGKGRDQPYPRKSLNS